MSVLLIVLAVATAALAACGDDDGGGPATPAVDPWRGGYPSSIAVLGHSWPAGADSDPSRPGEEVKANSWATGTNPKVRSVYLRILAHNRAIEGNNFNLARGGDTVEGLVLQARRAVSLDPKPALVLVQIMDNDITCPATARDYADFRARFVDALEILERGLPESRFFVVSQFGSPTTYLEVLTPVERGVVAGTGPCAFAKPDGGRDPEALAEFERIVQGYEAQLQAGCGRVHRCTYDGGAFGRIVDDREHISTDLIHASVAGQAKAAAVAWAALGRTGVLPR